MSVALTSGSFAFNFIDLSLFINPFTVPEIIADMLPAPASDLSSRTFPANLISESKKYSPGYSFCFLSLKQKYLLLSTMPFHTVSLKNSKYH